MTPKQFVDKFYPFAKQTQDKTGISAIAILSQAAVESGWGDHALGNMFFGVKDTDGINGNEQLITTTEYSLRPNLSAKELGVFKVLSSIPTIYLNIKKYKYTCQAYFRKYDTPEESFTDHANFIINNSRYSEALKVKEDPYAFIDAISKAGYATDPSYATLLKSVAKSIEKLVP